jgi:hypothetical protein
MGLIQHILFVVTSFLFLFVLDAMTEEVAPPSPELLLQLLPPTLPGVDSVERDNTDLTRAVYHESRVNRPCNTSIAYDPKVAEFNGYCDAMYAHVGVDIRYQVTPEKVYNFLFFQSHCEKKKTGRGKAGEREKAGVFSPSYCTSQ